MKEEDVINSDQKSQSQRRKIILKGEIKGGKKKVEDIGQNINRLVGVERYRVEKAREGGGNRVRHR